MGIHTPAAQGAFVEGLLHFFDLCGEFARATKAWTSSLNLDALDLVSLERDLDTLRPLYPAVLPRFNELDTVLRLAERQKLQDPELAKRVEVFKTLLGATSRHAQALSQKGLFVEGVMDLMGRDAKKLSPEEVELKKAYEGGWEFTYSLERQWFNLLCDTAEQAFQSGGKKSLSVWSAALERFLKPEERMEIPFMIPQENKPVIRHILGLCGRRGDVCGPLMAKLIAWQRDNDQVPAQQPIPSYMH